MITLTELINAINEQPDLSARCDDFLYASARQSDKGNVANANTLLIEAVNLLRDNVAIRNDLLISQVAFEFVRMGQMNRAGNAVNYIADETTKNEALGRMAIERAKTNAQDAVNIAQAITDSAIQNDTLASITTNVAITGDLTTARIVAQMLPDDIIDPQTGVSLKYQIDRQAIRESSKGL